MSRKKPLPLLSRILIVPSLLVPAAVAAAQPASPKDCATCPMNPKVFEEVVRVDCDTRVVAQAIVAQKKQVPKSIYYYGGEYNVLRYVRDRAVAKEDWDKYMFGPAPTIGQAPFRQGLYGTTNPIDLVNYGMMTDDKWLMEIRIKDSCRQPGAVAAFEGLPQDSRFVRWFKKSPRSGFADLKSFIGSCYPDGAGDMPSNLRMIDGQQSSRAIHPCEKVLEDFLREEKIKTVLDDMDGRSWYLRDLDCVETIRGTPEELLGVFAEKSELWIQTCEGMAQPKQILNFLVKVLTKAEKPIPSETLNGLDKNVQSADSGKFEGKNLFLALLKSYRACAKQDKLAEFREVFKGKSHRQQLDLLIPTESLKKLCGE